jgi:hypothetical protein
MHRLCNRRQSLPNLDDENSAVHFFHLTSMAKTPPRIFRNLTSMAEIPPRIFRNLTSMAKIPPRIHPIEPRWRKFRREFISSNLNDAGASGAILSSNYELQESTPFFFETLL